MFHCSTVVHESRTAKVLVRKVSEKRIGLSYIYCSFKSLLTVPLAMKHALHTITGMKSLEIKFEAAFTAEWTTIYLTSQLNRALSINMLGSE